MSFQPNMNSNDDIANFWVDNTQNRNDDAFLSTIQLENELTNSDNTENQSERSIENFYVDNTQNRSDDELLMSFVEPGISDRFVENFYADNSQNRQEDRLLSESYNNYLATLFKNVCQEHNYANRVSNNI